MILTLLLNTQMISKMSSKILKSTIKENKCKVLIVFDDMIADIINYKKFVSIVTKKLGAETLTFYLYLMRSHILRYQDMLDSIL